MNKGNELHIMAQPWSWSACKKGCARRAIAQMPKSGHQFSSLVNQTQNESV